MAGGWQHSLCLRGLQGSQMRDKCPRAASPLSALPVPDAAEVGTFNIWLPGRKAIPDIEFWKLAPAVPDLPKFSEKISSPLG